MEKTPFKRQYQIILMLQNDSFTGVTNWGLRHPMPSQNEWNGHAATKSYLVQVNP
jgi:hypothetical protein